ncbi:hypothetical protein M9Y10_001071 [Tritrichomonas musculus]|uniref:Ubiquitin-like domain-containing protein n=1 Tax=Tritrichomonas musculus TaxID=1915356 RepID=A0ABR2L5Z5_9EUKA
MKIQVVLQFGFPTLDFDIDPSTTLNDLKKKCEEERRFEDASDYFIAFMYPHGVLVNDLKLTLESLNVKEGDQLFYIYESIASG